MSITSDYSFTWPDDMHTRLASNKCHKLMIDSKTYTTDKCNVAVSIKVSTLMSMKYFVVLYFHFIV